MASILVLNPNSSQTMTQTIDRSLDDLRRQTGHRLTCRTNPSGPEGIETDAHVAEVIPAVLHTIQSEQADAYVIACFSDPGVDDARRKTAKPVLGIAEAAFLTAMGVGERFGVISILDDSLPRHRHRLQSLHALGRLAADRAIGVGVSQLNGPDVLEKLCTVGRLLRDVDHADTIILGCAGMGAYKDPLQDALGVPVIDPVKAAVALAGAFVTLDLRGRTLSPR